MKLDEIKELFILIDGTSNSPEAVTGNWRPTNVEKLFDHLRGIPVQSEWRYGWQTHHLKPVTSSTSSSNGLVYYDRGLGSPKLDDQGNIVQWTGQPLSFFTSESLSAIYSKFRETSESLVATGILDNVAQAYRFLVENYIPPDADGTERCKVFLFGFSRGAYTITILIQILRYFGLVDKTRCEGRTVEDVIEEAFKSYSMVTPPELNKDAVEFHKRYCFKQYKNLVNFMGLWDCVRGMVVEKTHDTTKLNSVVQAACHAVAIDEERPVFAPKLWEDDPRLKQVWFAGVHCDIGGGYMENDLSNIAFNWMMNEAAIPEKIKPGKPVNPLGIQHDSYNARVHENLRIRWSDVTRPPLNRIVALKAQSTLKISINFHESVKARSGKRVIRKLDKNEESFIYHTEDQLNHRKRLRSSEDEE